MRDYTEFGCILVPVFFKRSYLEEKLVIVNSRDFSEASIHNEKYSLVTLF